MGRATASKARKALSGGRDWRTVYISFTKQSCQNISLLADLRIGQATAEPGCNCRAKPLPPMETSCPPRELRNEDGCTARVPHDQQQAELACQAAPIIQWSQYEPIGEG